MINQATIIGRLTKDPDLKYTQQGKPVANYQLAVKRPYKDSSGNNPTDFISVVTWDKDGEFIANNGKKGAMVAVRGRWETRSYDHSQYPIKIYVNELNTDEVQLLDWDNSQQGGGAPNYAQQPPGGSQPQHGYSNQQRPNQSNQQPGNGQQYNAGGYTNNQPPQYNHNGYQGGQPQPGNYQSNPNAVPHYPPNQGYGSPYGTPNQGAAPFSSGSGPIDVNDDDLPF